MTGPRVGSSGLGCRGNSNSCVPFVANVAVSAAGVGEGLQTKRKQVNSPHRGNKHLEFAEMCSD